MSDLASLSSYLYLQQLKSFSVAIKPWAAGSSARVEPELNTLFFYSSPNKLEEFKANVQTILAVAYLKLGCNSISLWCGITHHGVYNVNTEQLQLPDTMVSNLNSSTSTTTSSSNWISFQTVASALNVPVEQVEKTIEDQDIPAKRQQGEWGLSQDAAQSLIQSHYQLQMAESLSRIGIQQAESSSQVLVADAPSTLETEQMNAHLEPYLQRTEALTALTNPVASMTLPDGYSVKKGRTRNPVPSAALREALDALPNAGVEKPRYLERIMLKKADAMQFLSAIASQYNKPQEVLPKLREEASKLWDEVNQESAA